MIIKTRADARREIEEALAGYGPYTHNLISCVLKIVAKRWGFRDSNKLVSQYRLESLGIQKVKR